MSSEPTDPLDRLEEAASKVAVHVNWEQDNRRGLLWVHAICGMWIGALILIFGGPGNIERSLGVWTRPTLGGLALLGGAVLASGLLSRPRNVIREIVGLVIIGIWDACMTGGIIAARIDQGEFSPRALLEVQPEGYVVPYPIIVYGGLLALISIHLWTLVKLRRSGFKR